MDSLNLAALPAGVQSRILGKLNFMDDILTGKIAKPPGMTITTGPSPLDDMVKAVRSDMHHIMDDDIMESSSTLFESQPPTKKPSLLFNTENLKNLESLNEHKSNPIKYPLSNLQILSLQNDGYIIIDDYVNDQELIKNVQNEINLMNENGKMKKAGLRRLNTKNDKDNIEINGSGTYEINGIYEIYEFSKDLLLSTLINKQFKMLSNIGYIKNNEYFIIKIETTQKLSLFVDTATCWIVFKYSNSMDFPIIYYVAGSKEINNDKKLDVLDVLQWQCIGGVLPFGIISNTNKWISSSIRNDLHCWLHSDDVDIGKSLKKCIISMDEIRVQLNKVINFNSNTTQVQATLYPGNGSKYRTHIDEPPNINKNTGKRKRKLTCLMYFNLFHGKWDKNKYGGCLRIYLGDNKYKDIEPFGGRLVLFNSQWLPHQVLPSYFNRYAVSMWMY